MLSCGLTRTRDKVGEMATAHLSPDEFAEVAVQVCRTLNDAFLIWEMNGPGVAFGKRVVALGYENIYLRQDELGLRGKVQNNLTPGWSSNAQNKLMVLQDYARALGSATFVNHSEEALKECRHYVYLPTGEVGNHRSQTSADPSGARQNHGDRVIADALCNKGMGEVPGVRLETGAAALPEDDSVLLPGHPLHYSQWGRMLAEKKAERERDEWGDGGDDPWRETSIGWKG